MTNTPIELVSYNVCTMHTLAALLFFATTVLVFPRPADAAVENSIHINTNGSDAQVSVDVQNSVGGNTGSEGTSRTDSNTSVEIHQSGDGKSTVTVNGKEYSVDGPGDLSVTEPTDGTDGVDSGYSENQGEDVPDDTVVDPSPAPSPNPENPTQTEIIDRIHDAFTELTRLINDFFDSIL